MRCFPLAVEKQMGIIGMKIPGRGRILSTWTPPPIEQQKHSWEGMTIQTDKPGTLTMREAMYYTLSRPVSTVIIGCDTTRAARRECAAGAQFHADQRKAADRTSCEGRTLRQAVTVLPLLRPALKYEIVQSSQQNSKTTSLRQETVRQPS